MEVATEMDEKWICPNCGAKMQQSDDGLEKILVCPECGCSIEASEQNLDSLRTCPNCNQIMDDSNECSNCGYDLGSDFD